MENKFFWNAAYLNFSALLWMFIISLMIWTKTPKSVFMHLQRIYFVAGCISERGSNTGLWNLQNSSELQRILQDLIFRSIQEILWGIMLLQDSGLGKAHVSMDGGFLFIHEIWLNSLHTKCIRSCAQGIWTHSRNTQTC